MGENGKGTEKTDTNGSENVAQGKSKSTYAVGVCVYVKGVRVLLDFGGAGLALTLARNKRDNE